MSENTKLVISSEMYSLHMLHVQSNRLSKHHLVPNKSQKRWVAKIINGVVEAPKRKSQSRFQIIRVSSEALPSNLKKMLEISLSRSPSIIDSFSTQSARPGKQPIDM